ncbi:MAG: polyamine aminopropyltransferase [Symbiobacteriia bacterium]
MELWFTEEQTRDLRLGLRVTSTLVAEQTEFQNLAVVDTAQYGRMLVLDGCVMTTEKDEFVYHEMIAHVPLFTHPNPKDVLVVGGGDGGVIREVLKHASVDRAVLAEIDPKVIERSREWLPSISGALSSERCELMVGDGIAHVREHKQAYDVIISDSTDPIGPAVGLFEESYYLSCWEALRDDGIFVAQTESPFLHPELIRETYQKIASVFPITRLYLATIPTYPGSLWSFTLGSKAHDPLGDTRLLLSLPIETKYYSPAIHKAAFTLPPFVERLTRK